MAKRKRSKKARGSRGASTAIIDGKQPSKDTPFCDLMVAIPKDSDTKVQSQLQIREIIERLVSTGFTHMALTHTIFGKPRPGEDHATKAIPSSFWSTTSKTDNPPTKKKKSTTTLEHLDQPSGTPIKIYRRLHSVLENLSDVGSFILNGPDSQSFDGYDLISVAPRNEATFQSACDSATAADIITLDYASGSGLKLPFRIRSADVRAATERGAAFEIHFAPAMLKAKMRKALVQTCTELQMASAGKKPIVLFSSGDRTNEEGDVGSMALRLPGDLTNILQVLLKFDSLTAHGAVGSYALEVMERAERKRLGETDVIAVTIGKERPASVDKSVTKSIPGHSSAKNDESFAEEDGPEDGFISMT